MELQVRIHILVFHVVYSVFRLEIKTM